MTQTHPVDLDPDPDRTPTATPWQRYLAAAQALDAMCREAASASAATIHLVSSGRAELARAQARLTPQRAELVEAATQAGVAPPAVDPSPAEWDSALAMASGPAAAADLLRRCHDLIESADSTLRPRRFRLFRWPWRRRPG